MASASTTFKVDLMTFQRKYAMLNMSGQVWQFMNFRISRDSPLPLHIQLLDELRHAIKSGKLKPHDQLPGEWNMVETFGISRATIQRAWQAAQEEGLLYRVAGKGTFVAEPPPQEQNARPVVGFVIPEYRGTFALNLLKGAEQVLRKQGYTVQFATTDRDLTEENRILEEFVSDGVQGVILVPKRGHHQRVLTSANMNIPVVLMDRPLNGVVLPCVSSNNYAGGIQAMRHLVELGHRNILFVARPHLDLWSVSERYRAYQDVLRLEGIDPPMAFLIGGENELSSYEAYLSHNDSEIQPLIDCLLDDNRPTAIFAVNDWIGIKVQRAIQLAGLNCPQDVSLVGFDNLDIAQYQSPPLTTVAQDPMLMGAEAARRLITILEGEQAREIVTLLPTELVIRESTARPK
jgi:GntR family transcriptional regulator of arabinose operon